jgi:tetratricopeptide (TPR) repeat protein
MKKQLFVIAALWLFSLSSLTAQGQPSLGTILDLAYQSIDTGVQQNNKGALMQARALLEQALNANPDNPYVLYAMGYAEYRILCISYVKGEDQLFDQFSDSTISHAEKAAADSRLKSDASALLGSVYGMKISKNWNQAQVLGPKSSRLIAEAIQSDSTNPRAWFFAGVSQYSTPEFFGGGKNKAAVSFLRAIRCAESASVSDSLLPRWGLLDALIWSGRTAEATEDPATAISMYRRVLELAPDYGWVKYNLLPDAEKKLATAK